MHTSSFVSYHLALTAVEHYAHVSLWIHAARWENYAICDELLLSSEVCFTSTFLDSFWKATIDTQWLNSASQNHNWIYVKKNPFI